MVTRRENLPEVVTKMKRGHLLIRADAGTQMGSGHIMRCLALAQVWQGGGGDVTFLSHSESNVLPRRIIKESFNFIPIEKPHPDPCDLKQILTTLKQLETRNSKLETWVVLDGYHFAPDYQEAIRRNGYRLLVIDDMAHFDDYFADILLNQNLHAAEGMYSTGKSRPRLLLGPRYVLLRQEFLTWTGWQREIPDMARKIMITMGGSDPGNATLKVIHALNLLNEPDLEVKIVAGHANPNIECIQKELSRSPFTFDLLPSVNDIPELMAWADVAVSAAGSTCWELSFMGLPGLLLVLSHNQQPVAEKMHKLGAAVNLGLHHNLPYSHIAHAIKNILSDPVIRTEMARNCRNVIDGRGAARILMCMDSNSLQFRKVGEKDCKLIWKWANEDDTRQASFSSDIIPWNRHLQWFRSKLNDPNCIFYIVSNGEGIPAGQIRYDMNGDEADISLTLDRKFRNKGYGSAAILLSSQKIFGLQDIKTIHAYVKHSNNISINAFSKAGFNATGTKTIKNHEAIDFVLSKETTI